MRGGLKYIPGDLVTLDINPKEILKVILVSTAASTWINNEVSYSLEIPNGRIICSKQRYLQGIPLTPQILKNNGWDLSIVKDGYYWSKVNNEEELVGLKAIDASIQHRAVKKKIALIYFSSNTNAFFFELSHTVIRIKYCHELQHLLFGLGLNSELKV